MQILWKKYIPNLMKIERIVPFFVLKIVRYKLESYFDKESEL